MKRVNYKITETKVNLKKCNSHVKLTTDFLINLQTFSLNFNETETHTPRISTYLASSKN